MAQAQGWGQDKGQGQGHYLVEGQSQDQGNTKGNFQTEGVGEVPWDTRHLSGCWGVSPQGSLQVLAWVTIVERRPNYFRYSLCVSDFHMSFL